MNQVADVDETAVITHVLIWETDGRTNFPQIVAFVSLEVLKL